MLLPLSINNDGFKIFSPFNFESLKLISNFAVANANTTQGGIAQLVRASDS